MSMFAPLLEKLHNALVNVCHRPGMQKGIAEPDEVAAPLAKQRTYNDISADHVVLKLPKGHAIQAGMRVRVIAEVEPRVEPLRDNRGTAVALTLNIQLPLIHENRRRNVLSLQRFDKAG